MWLWVTSVPEIGARSLKGIQVLNMLPFLKKYVAKCFVLAAESLSHMILGFSVGFVLVLVFFPPCFSSLWLLSCSHVNAMT